jgi:hypothetical protein
VLTALLVRFSETISTDKVNDLSDQRANEMIDETVGKADTVERAIEAVRDQMSAELNPGAPKRAQRGAKLDTRLPTAGIPADHERGSRCGGGIQQIGYSRFVACRQADCASGWLTRRWPRQRLGDKLPIQQGGYYVDLALNSGVASTRHPSLGPRCWDHPISRDNARPSPPSVRTRNDG